MESRGQGRFDEFTSTEPSIEDQKEEEFYNARSSMEELSANLDKQNERKTNLLTDLQHLRQRIEEKGVANGGVQKLLPLLYSLKALERQESVLQSIYDDKRSQLQAEVNELEDKIAAAWDIETLSKDLDRVLSDSLEKLNSAKKEQAAQLRAILSVKRQIDDIPTESELVQYERRFSELNAYIQEKHRQTRKYYATYNALLEIKELMLKETSLLNSISSQFQDAITSTDGRMKLIGSMEGIVKSSQRKLQKVQVGLQEEQKACDALKKRYAAAMAEQRRCYSLLKDFQEECTKNDRLQSRSCLKQHGCLV
ncbi:hypothetical protein P3X46_007275 [Hevea brasiliensis]|uniref:CCDC93 coiled-coil domain-containing protein n=1 Tax=Hevea brasiliensis TaxID=3981 RepID=A0ABQ9MT35_HEVBR|nr:uncharacterized protein LOC110657415 isoform X1 [Hevea brasiliensis]KAJ9183421.1 hypothetical protein P3X46_007275 [Hevea brasiliensis]